MIGSVGRARSGMPGTRPAGIKSGGISSRAPYFVTSFSTLFNVLNVMLYSKFWH